MTANNINFTGINGFHNVIFPNGSTQNINFKSNNDWYVNSNSPKGTFVLTDTFNSNDSLAYAFKDFVFNNSVNNFYITIPENLSNATGMFQNIKSLGTFNFKGDFNNVEIADSMFNIANIDFYNLDLSDQKFDNLVSATNMFSFTLPNYTNIKLRLDNANFSNLTNASHMFYSLIYRGFTNYNLSSDIKASFDNVVDASYMFASSGTNDLKLDNATFNNVTNAYAMFGPFYYSSTSYFDNLTLNNATFKSATNVSNMFSSGPGVSFVGNNLSLSNATFENVVNAQFMFFKSGIPNLNLVNASFNNLVYAYDMFGYSAQTGTQIIKSLEGLGKAGLQNLSNATSMFAWCNISKFFSGDSDNNVSFSNVVNAFCMFESSTFGSSNAIGLNNATFENAVSIANLMNNANFNTNNSFAFLANATFNNATNAVSAFAYLNHGGRYNLALPSATFKLLTNATSMFDHTATAQPILTNSLANFDTVTDASLMFNGANVNLSVFESQATFANLQDASGMFQGFLTQSIDMQVANFANVTNTASMFFNIKNISLNLNNANFSNVLNANSMFANTNLNRNLTDPVLNLTLTNATDISSIFQNSNLNRQVNMQFSANLTSYTNAFFNAKIGNTQLTAANFGNNTDLYNNLYTLFTTSNINNSARLANNTSVNLFSDPV